MPHDGPTPIQIDAAFVAQLIQDTKFLFSSVLQKTENADDRSKMQGVEWYKRHRLHVLLDAAEETEARLPSAIFAPWFLAELMATNKIAHKWKNTAVWKEIRGALVSPTEFTHTILTLQLADRLQLEGHKVEIVPSQRNATPDLKLRAIGGTQDWVYVECKQPRVLDGRDVAVSEGHAKRILNKAMDKAKPQLGETVPGILAVCSYNQSRNNLIALERATEKRLNLSSRPNLLGILLFSQGVLFKEDQGQVSFTPIVTVRFVPNPNYYGRVEIAVSTPAEDPTLVRDPLVDINTQRLKPTSPHAQEDILSPEETAPDSKWTKRATSRKVIKLTLIDDPAQNRVVMEWQGKSASPLFRGEGEVNFVCANCQMVIAERVWEVSIMNLVAKCPSCSSYNDFPSLKRSSLPLIGTIGVKPGRYPLSNTVHVRRSVPLIGV